VTARDPYGFEGPAGPAAPTEQLEVAAPPRPGGRGLLSGRRPSPTGVFGLGFVLLLAAVAAAGFAHFTASGIAPWLSIGCSGGAVACTVAALVLGRER
jgi:hypothetical protein